MEVDLLQKYRTGTTPLIYDEKIDGYFHRILKNRLFLSVD